MFTQLFNVRRVWAVVQNLALTLYILFSFCCASSQVSNAACAPVRSALVYMLDENGQPQQVPDACIQQGAVFTNTNVLLGYVASDNVSIVDSDGNIVGSIGIGPTEAR